MPKIVFDYPDPTFPDVLKDFCEAQGYQDKVTDPVTGEPMPNPETRRQYFEKIIRLFVRESVKQTRCKVAQAEVIRAKAAEVDAQLPV